MMALQTSNVNGWYYQMEGATQGCVERYLELAGISASSLRKVGTPSIDDHTRCHLKTLKRKEF